MNNENSKDKFIKDLQTKLASEMKCSEELQFNYENEVKNNQIATLQYDEMKKLLSDEIEKYKSL